MCYVAISRVKFNSPFGEQWYSAASKGYKKSQGYTLITPEKNYLIHHRADDSNRFSSPVAYPSTSPPQLNASNCMVGWRLFFLK